MLAAPFCLQICDPLGGEHPALKRAMRFVPHALLFCVLAASSLARVADTAAQVQARYGQTVQATAAELGTPVLREATELVFENNGWRIRCGLVKAKDEETYVVREEWSHMDGSLLYAQQVSPLRTWMRPGCDWTEFPQGCAWTGSDGTLIALQPDQKSFRIDLPQAFQHEGIEAPNAAAWAKDRDQRAAIIAGMKEQEAWRREMEAVPRFEQPPQKRLPAMASVEPVRQPERGAAVFGVLIVIGGIIGCIQLFAKKADSPRPPCPIQYFEGPPKSSANDSAPAKAKLEDLNWEEFELLVGELYRRQGYEVELCAGLGGDGGIDLVLHKNGERILVQCKKWNAWKIPPKEIREFFGTLIDSGAARGIFVTTQEFSRDAREFASGKAIELVDGQLLKQMLLNGNYAASGDLMNLAQWTPTFFAASRLTNPTTNDFGRPRSVSRRPF
jgi:HJR/Mrr/RecB family endonuclease